MWSKDNQMEVRILSEEFDIANDTMEKFTIDETGSDSDLELDIHSFSDEDFSSCSDTQSKSIDIYCWSSDELSPFSSRETKLSEFIYDNNHIKLRTRQQLNLLVYFLDLSISEEIERFSKDVSITTLKDSPFLQFVYQKLFQQCPWVPKDQSMKFWANLESFLKLLNKLKLSTSADRGETSYTAKSYSNLRKTFVILFKNILRAPLSRQQLKEEVEKECEIVQHEASTLHTENVRTDLHDSDRTFQKNYSETHLDKKVERNKAPYSSPILDSIVLENYQSEGGADIKIIRMKKKFRVEIVATRNLVDRHTSNAYQEYIIEAKYGNKHGRTAHRYSNFEIFHNTLKQNFQLVKLPILPAKKRFQKHTQEFIEIRKRELSAYLHKLCSIPEIRNSAEIVAFLLPGMSVALTDEEQKYINERNHLDIQIEVKIYEFKSLIAGLFQESQGFDQLKLLFPSLQKAVSIADLPPDFITVINYSRSIFSYLLYHIFHRDIKCEKIYLLTPFTTLKSIASVSNPGKVLNGIVNQFLAKPLGSRNLLQSFVSDIYLQDYTMSEDALKAVRNSVSNTQICKKINNFVLSNQKIPPIINSQYERAEYILSCAAVQPTFVANVIHNILLQKEMIKKIVKLYKIELRQNDLRTIVDFYGNDRVVGLLKEILNALLQPFINLLSGKDLGDLINHIREIMYNIIEVAESRTESPFVVYQKYSEIIAKIELILFDFLHKSSCNDRHSHYLENTLNWLLGIFDIARKDNLDKKFPVDIESLLNELQNDHQVPRFFQDMKKLDEYSLNLSLSQNAKNKKIEDYLSSNNNNNNNHINNLKNNLQGAFDTLTDYSKFTSIEPSSPLLSLSDFNLLKETEDNVPILYFLPTLKEKFLKLVDETLFSKFN